MEQQRVVYLITGSVAAGKSNLTPEETIDEILAQTPSTRSPIVVTDYDEEWPLLFE